ncbi:MULTISPECIES: MMPL family transporter [unclassified Streptomyces]|uniref:MMPL family transporter n=1 Tax=unclassified Streptomyces TaxID=2593676 RepID=UPI002DD7ED50|nr:MULTISPECIES: MMPL family transporter [unclassified Streptomyces]WSB77892.1 MMPL family transporter [Streptomyces sp. NBC_01775]WSS13850.1 MMPL family transporter [Streptomyces sp. NBC_01186]WSS42676.1 MMPL family transporter [Streptomyces sp. NBC_01187]
MRDLPVRAARWSALHPWRAITGWLLFVVVCLGTGIAVGGNPATTEDYRVGEAGRAEAVATEGGLGREPVEQVLITARSGPLDRAESRRAAHEVRERMRGLPEVERVGAPVRSHGGKALRVRVTMKGEELEGKKHVDPLLAQTAAVGEKYPSLRVEEVGSPSIGKGVDGQRSDDLLLSEGLTLPLTLLTLLIVFGSVTMAAVPLLLAVTSIVAAMGLAMLASHLSPDAGVGNNVILLIGMAVGVDYTLFYLKREREERARSGGRLSSEALVELAAATSGRAVVVSGLAVIVSTATLYLVGDVIFASLATGTVVVVLVAVLSSLTVLPALLVKLGKRAERRAASRRPGSRAALRAERRAARARAKGDGRVWQALMRPASRRPGLTLCLSSLLMLGLAAPALALNLGVMDRDTHSREIPVMRAFDRLHAHYPELQVVHQVAVRSAPARAGQVSAALDKLAQRVQRDPLFTGDSRKRVSADRRVAVLDLPVAHRPGSDASLDSLARLREDHLPATVAAVPGAEAVVSGEGNVARDADYLDHQNQKLPQVIVALVLVTFLMTLAAFRSVVIALVGVVLNLLSAAAALGLLVLVFQGEWAQGLLGFTSTGSIGSRVPLFLFVILFGLSMDYQVFVVSRIREAVLRGVPTRQAVVDGITSSAGVVTSAAMVMVTVFASFVFLHLIEMKQIGFSLAAAVLLDAFVIRVLVLPSAMLLLGRATWWPGRPSRAEPR